MKIYFTVWAALAVAVALLALYRRLVSQGHFTVLHVRRSELPLVPGEMAYGRRLEWVDRWGKILTWIVFLYGGALVAYYLYLQLNARPVS